MTTTKKPSSPIACILPAFPGWRLLFLEHDAEGKRVPLREAPNMSRFFSEPIVAWGLIPPDPRGTASLTSIFGSFFGAPSTPAGALLCPLGAENKRLDETPCILGYAFPDETDAQAVERIERPVKEENARLEKVRARLEVETESRWSVAEETPADAWYPERTDIGFYRLMDLVVRKRGSSLSHAAKDELLELAVGATITLPDLPTLTRTK